MKISAIIPTCNRPFELGSCLRSLAAQTRLPDEVIVVDDGELPEMPCRSLLEGQGTRCLFIKKHVKGLTRSRNLGVSHATGDLIFFFDDDVVIEPDYLDAQYQCYQRHPDPLLGGLGGIDLQLSPPTLLTWLEYAYNLFFLISSPRPGHPAPSGFSEINLVERLFPPRKIRKVKIMGGALFSFRRVVFDFFSFSEDYDHPYCQGEDKDFCIKVSSKFNLYINPSARLRHFNSPITRTTKYRRGYDHILSAYRLFRRLRETKDDHSLIFFYSCTGYLMKKALGAMVKRDQDEWDRVRGIWRALRQVASMERNRRTPPIGKL